MLVRQAFLLLLSLLFTGTVAAEPADCHTVRFADTGWTDITATTAATGLVLEALGYHTETQLLSVPITYVALKNARVDVFLGNWMPTMSADIARYVENGDVESVRTNLDGARYTLAVPAYVATEGIASFADLASSGAKFDYKIYGLEFGNDGNRIIRQLIKERAFDLSDFKLVESRAGETDLLQKVSSAIEKQEWIVFLAWEPHPMNQKFELTYLAGGDAYFGPDYGHATVHTNVRRGYLETCPNVAKLLNNLVFTLDMENALMYSIMQDNLQPRQAFKHWLRQDDSHVTLVQAWLTDVKKVDGSDTKGVIDAIMSP